jgi:hypothetical protein
MKRVALALLAVLLPVSAFGATPMTVCRIKANITDPDPKGANVRATPGGKVIATLKNTADWIEVTITGQAGDWYEIASALQTDNDGPLGDHVVFRGKGYLHKSTLGLSGLMQGATIYGDHDLKSRALISNADGDQQADLMGCWQDFYKVHLQKGTGWTRTVCLNEHTTCA